MKKRWVFTGVAGLLGALFLGCVLWVGGASGWFGLGALAAGEEPAWEHAYPTTWDPAGRPVEDLLIQWGSGPVEVRVGEGPVVTVTEYASRPLEAGEMLSLSFSGGALEIAWDGGLLPLGGLQNWQKRLVVEVPQDIASQLDEFSCGNTQGDIKVNGFTAETARVSSLSGDVDLAGFNGVKVNASTVSGAVHWQGGSAQEVDVETNSGPVSLSDVTAQDCRLKTVTGRVDFAGSSALAFAVETVSGDVSTRLGACPQEADLRSAAGDITVNLEENSGFAAEYASVSGRFSSDFTGAGEKGRLLYGSGGPKLTLATTWGDMEIQRVTGVYAEMVGG